MDELEHLPELGTELEANLMYGNGAAEVIWSHEVADEQNLNTTNLPIRVAVKDADKFTQKRFALIRRGGFGGSDAATLVGANPYKKTFESVKTRDGISEPLVEQKARKEISAEEFAVGEKAAVRKGRELEPMVINKVTEIFGIRVMKPTHLYAFREYPYLRVNYDGVGIFTKPKQEAPIDPEAYMAEFGEMPERRVIYPRPDFSWIANVQGYAPIEIKIATMYGMKSYNPTKAIYSEARIYMGQNPWQVAPPMLTNEQLTTMSMQEKADYFGIPVYYYGQVQQEMFGLNANGGFLAALFELDWHVHIFYVQKDPVVWAQIVANGEKAARYVNALRIRRGEAAIIAENPEMDKELRKLHGYLEEEVDTITVAPTPGSPAAQILENDDSGDAG